LVGRRERCAGIEELDEREVGGGGAVRCGTSTTRVGVSSACGGMVFPLGGVCPVSAP
jgi:hypothetical protein